MCPNSNDSSSLQTSSILIRRMEPDAMLNAVPSHSVSEFSRRQFLSALPLMAGAPALGASKPPNIVYMYADDLGYGDVSCYGATHVKTPNIDRAAASGI